MEIINEASIRAGEYWERQRVGKLRRSIKNLQDKLAIAQASMSDVIEPEVQVVEKARKKKARKKKAQVEVVEKPIEVVIIETPKERTKRPEPIACITCGNAQRVREFAKAQSKGVQVYLACRSCRRAEKDNLESQAIKTSKSSLRDELINRLGGKCFRCTYNEFREALEFHHCNRKEKQGEIAKLIDRAAMRGYPTDWEALEAEILKCILLCSNCHQACHRGCWDEHCLLQGSRDSDAVQA